MSSASVPFMITVEMRRKLGLRGVTPAEIDALTPAEAWVLIQRRAELPFRYQTGHEPEIGDVVRDHRPLGDPDVPGFVVGLDAPYVRVLLYGGELNGDVIWRITDGSIRWPAQQCALIRRVG